MRRSRRRLCTGEFDRVCCAVQPAKTALSPTGYTQVSMPQTLISNMPNSRLPMRIRAPSRVDSTTGCVADRECTFLPAL